ncbi:MAG: lamin tail domain-containing protein, partial [Akkermansiaceae bacterium]|nr:lamin tail domain-containing protein [Akkermansiaceae bacterium]
QPASPPLSSSLSSINSYLTSRRNVLFNNYTSLIPGPQPADPDIRISGAEHNPASWNQDEEFIILTNHETTEIDLSGWSLSGGIEFTFAPGTVIERGGDLYLSPDTLAFRNRPDSPHGNEGHLVVGPYSGHLSNFGETLTLKNREEVAMSSFTTPVDPSDPQLYLVVSEIMYHPAPDPDAEFIELMNISDSVTLDLTGVHFTRGIDYAFPAGTMLAPGARIVVRFPEFRNDSRLNNGSDRIKLEDATNSTIREFAYNDELPWPAGPDGGGFSLVLVNPVSNPDHSDPANWRESTKPGGNPGTTDAVTFGGDPLADLDSDGFGALLEYATGTSDLIPGGSPVRLSSTTAGRLTITLQVNLGADDLHHRLQLSDDLVDWVDATPEFSL